MGTWAVFGGSFDPPHVAHQQAVLWVLETRAVERVLVVPVFRHVFDKAHTAWADRLEMCRRAMAPLGDRVEVSTIEEELGGDSKTLHTLEALAARHPDVAWRLVVGTDIQAETAKWHRWDEVVRRAPPIWLTRPGHPVGDSPPMAEISSTAIRARLGRGEDVSALVPARVVDYLRERRLYPGGPA